MPVGPLIKGAALVAILAVVIVVPAARAESAPPRVTVIGDSVMTGVLWHDEALSILAKGIDLQMEVEVCRRLTGESCPGLDGTRPPTLVELVGSRGAQLGKVAVVVAGYNEPESLFAGAVEDSVAALLGEGVSQILWATLAEASPAFARMNESLVARAVRHRELTIVDWNATSRGHRDWFQTDGVHLTLAGAIGMASLLRQALDGALSPPPMAAVALTPPVASTPPPMVLPVTPLPVGRVGLRYVTRLVASGGTTPYHWKVISGSLPPGLRLAANGRISGTPTTSGRTRLIMRAQDATGMASTRRVILIVTA